MPCHLNDNWGARSPLGLPRLLPRRLGQPSNNGGPVISKSERTEPCLHAGREHRLHADEPAPNRHAGAVFSCDVCLQGEWCWGLARVQWTNISMMHGRSQFAQNAEEHVLRGHQPAQQRPSLLRNGERGRCPANRLHVPLPYLLVRR